MFCATRPSASALLPSASAAVVTEVRAWSYAYRHRHTRDSARHFYPIVSVSATAVIEHFEIHPEDASAAPALMHARTNQNTQRMRPFVDNPEVDRRDADLHRTNLGSLFKLFGVLEIAAFADENPAGF